MKKILFYMVLISLIGIFLYSGYKILHKMGEYKDIEDAYAEIADLVVQTVPTTVDSPEDASTYPVTLQTTEQDGDLMENPEATIKEPTIYDSMVAPIAVDFDTLCGINPDIVGWIYCEGTSINYPVLQGESNNTYLYHQYDGTYSAGGSIFMDYRCARDFTDDYTVIYGHNMLADSMFNCLDYFRKQSYLEEHSRVFYLTSDGKSYCLEVICTNLTAYKDDLRLFELRDDARNLELIRSMAEADTGIEASNEDQLVLLATCTYDYKNAKCTLLCKAIEITS